MVVPAAQSVTIFVSGKYGLAFPGGAAFQAAELWIYDSMGGANRIDEADGIEGQREMPVMGAKTYLLPSAGTYAFTAVLMWGGSSSCYIRGRTLYISTAKR